MIARARETEKKSHVCHKGFWLEQLEDEVHIYRTRRDDWKRRMKDKIKNLIWDVLSIT